MQKTIQRSIFNFQNNDVVSSQPVRFAASGAKTMAELMQKASNKSSITTLTKGQIIEGVITRLNPEIYVDVKAKTHALVLEKDRKIYKALISRFKVGDKVQVSVLSPESEFGYPVVSLRRYLDSISWDALSDLRTKKQTIKATVNSKTTGGYMLTTEDGVSGFMPNSQAQLLDESLGKKIDVYILELSKENKKVIFSQKPVQSKEEFEKSTAGAKIGQTVKAKVTSVTTFGIFVTIESLSLDGLVHISELSWEDTEKALASYSQGQDIEAKIIGFDRDAKRIDLSIKQLTKDPFEEAMKEYQTDQKVKGTISEIASNGVKIEISEGIEGFIRKEKIPPNVTYKEGQEIEATVSEVDKKKHRLVLVPVLKEKPIGYR